MSNIAIIDDRKTNRNIMVRLAQSVQEGLFVTPYKSPEDALAEFASGFVPDLIVTDYNMPQMDGATFIRTLRSWSKFSEVPIIVVTAYNDREYCYRALEAGASDFLLSPVDHLEFKARARNHLTMRRQQSLLQERAASLERALSLRDAPPGDDGLLGAPFAQIVDALPIAITAIDRSHRIQLINRAAENLFGADRDRLLGADLESAFEESYATRQRVENEKILQSGVTPSRPARETMVIAGEPRTILSTRAPITDPLGGVAGVLSASIDVSAIAVGDRLDDDVDPLTGLPGAAWLKERLSRELARARHSRESLTVILIDIDRLKALNDAYGEAFGDEILRLVAWRLRRLVGDDSLLARLDGDEFVVVRPNLQKPGEAAELARRLSDAFSEPLAIDGQEVHVSASMGVTTYPSDGGSAEILLKNADLAMYRAKSAGRDGYRFFAVEMNLAARRAVTMERELRQALASDQFVVHYQPQLDLSTGVLIGVEALVRWNHPRRGMVWPGEFIGLAEDIGLIAPLTQWVLKESCTQLRRWRDGGLDGLQLSVNLSPVQFRERGVEFLIEKILNECGVEPEQLDVELTENAVIEHSHIALASLRHLHNLGVSLSLDDFGTGYSSLSYVKRLPVNRLKIDRSFVQNLDKSSNDEVIVKAIINLGQSLGLKVIAEGVEKLEHVRALRRLGCDQVQGDFISKPVAAEVFDERRRAAAFPTLHVA